MWASFGLGLFVAGARPIVLLWKPCSISHRWTSPSVGLYLATLFIVWQVIKFRGLSDATHAADHPRGWVTGDAGGQSSRFGKSSLAPRFHSGAK